MPDLFTPLLVLLTVVLAWAPDRVSLAERWLLIAFAGFMTATHQSSIPLVIGVSGILAPLAVWRRHLPWSAWSCPSPWSRCWPWSRFAP